MIKLKWVLIQTTNILNIHWCYAFESWRSCLFISVCLPKGTCYMYAKIIAQCFTRLDVSTMGPLRVKTHWVEPLCWFRVVEVVSRPALSVLVDGCLFRETPGKMNDLNPKMKVWKMNFLFNWVIFRFQSFIFGGVLVLMFCILFFSGNGFRQRNPIHFVARSEEMPNEHGWDDQCRWRKMDTFRVFHGCHCSVGPAKSDHKPESFHYYLMILVRFGMKLPCKSPFRERYCWWKWDV